MFDEGPIALQHGQGTIKFRKVEVKEHVGIITIADTDSNSLRTAF
jgi:hypothetical protein